jgi:DNA polymerase III subunit alpha
MATPMTHSEQSQYLAYLVDRGIEERYGNEQHHAMADAYIQETVIPRVKEELRVITKLGFSEYFLVLADAMKYCRDNGIPVGPARGSAGGAVVSYVTGITDVDPLAFDLIFERFLNDERVAMPDIDTDLCWARRQEVLDYIVDKYGEDKVAQIVTFTTSQPKSLLDDLGRVLQIPKKDIEALKKFVPEVEKVTLQQLTENVDFMEKLHELNEKDPRLAPAMLKLEGIHRSASMHAGGIVISNEPMTNLAPVFHAKGKGRQIVQYEMMDAEAVGLLKMDLLGLRTVTAIDWAEKDVRRHYDPNFYTRGLRLDVKEAFDIINRGDTAGIFQLEGSGITKFAQEMIIESFNDIVALLALFRPGPLDSGAAASYINRKNGKETVTYPHPDLEPILKETYGIIIYQEQVMFILTAMCGWSMGRADGMRKAMGKKDAKLMEKELNSFKEAAMARGYTAELCDHIADLIRTFGRYGFNKSHAVAYSYLTYWNAVIKALYPECFYQGWLNVTDDGEKQGWIIDQAQRKGIDILPPDINESDKRFSVTGKRIIRFGLGAVKGMGDSFVAKTVNEREAGGPFTSYYDYCVRVTSVPVDKKEALVGAGAFDFDPTAHRGFLYERCRDIGINAKKLGKIDDANGIIEYYKYKYPDVYGIADLAPLEKAALEKQYINFHISADPMKNVREEIEMLGGIVGAKIENMRGEVLVGGVIREVHIVKTKKKQEDMAFITLDDGIETYSVTLFPQTWKRVADHMKNGEYSAMRCEVALYRGKPALQAMVVFPLNMTGNYEIKINLGRRTDRMTLAQLKYILDGAPQGTSDIRLVVRHGEHEFVLKSELYAIDLTDDIISRIKGLLGPDSVRLKGR